MQEIVQEESPSADDGTDEPVMKPPKTPEEVKEDEEKTQVPNEDQNESEKSVSEKVPEKVIESTTEKLKPVEKEAPRVTRRMTRSRNNSQENKTVPEVEVTPAVNLNTITEDKTENLMEVESDKKVEEIQTEETKEEELNSEIEITQSTGRKVSVNLERVKTPSKVRRGRSRQNSEEKEIVKTVVPLNLEAISEEKVNDEAFTY